MSESPYTGRKLNPIRTYLIRNPEENLRSVARKAGVHYNTLLYIYNGGRPRLMEARLGTLYRLAQVVESTIDAFINEFEDEPVKTFRNTTK